MTRPVDLLPVVDEQVRVAQRRQRAGDRPVSDSASVTTYWCDIGTTGTRTSDQRARSRRRTCRRSRRRPRTRCRPGRCARRVTRRAAPSTVGRSPSTRVCWRDPHAGRTRRGRQRVAQPRRVDLAVGRQCTPRRAPRRSTSAGTGPRLVRRDQLQRQAERAAPMPSWRRISSSRSGDDASRSDPDSDPARRVVAACSSAPVQRRPSSSSSGSAPGRRAAGRPARRSGTWTRSSARPAPRGARRARRARARW